MAIGYCGPTGNQARTRKAQTGKRLAHRSKDSGTESTTHGRTLTWEGGQGPQSLLAHLSQPENALNNRQEFVDARRGD